jgi:hypothetical protein
MKCGQETTYILLELEINNCNNKKEKETKLNMVGRLK